MGTDASRAPDLRATRARRVFVALLALSVIAAACESASNGGSNGAPSVAAACNEAVPWDQATAHVGEYTSVSGPVVSTYYAEDSNGQPTFINVGRDYPDPSRFTVVIWGDSRANFEQPPEKAYDGKVICVTGVVTIYQGAAQIEVAQPSQIVVKS